MKITLNLTHRCNLACQYCYSGRASKADMSYETARKSIDFALNTASSGRITEFCFFGGEPFLRFDLMKKITCYIRKREKKLQKTLRLSVTTNGTILSRPMLDFLKEERIDLCISIDGPEHVHNLNRCHKDGRGSFTEVAKNLQKALNRLDRVQVNAVYDPATIEFLPETASFFTGIGVPVIHLNPNISATWPKEMFPRLKEAFMKIADHYIQCYESGRETAVNFIDGKIILFMKDGYEAHDLCGMGETEWGVAPSGNLYPCERFIGEDDDHSFCLGNVHSGIVPERRCSLLNKRGNRNEECKTCELQKYCMNWCGCTNYHMTGRTNLAGPMLCKIEKSAIAAARHVLATLSESGNDLFTDHFMRHLYEGAH